MTTIGNVSSLPIGNVGETPSFSQGIAPTSSADGKTDKDMFLKLLVAQMKYQDPSKPADSTQMLSQMAQFTQVEKMDQLVDAYTNEMQATELTSATTMLGNTITWTDSKGKSQSGAVTGVSINGGVPTLMVGSQEVAISAVTKVEQRSGTTAPSTTPGTGTTAPSA